MRLDRSTDHGIIVATLFAPNRCTRIVPVGFFDILMSPQFRRSGGRETAGDCSAPSPSPSGRGCARLTGALLPPCREVGGPKGEVARPISACLGVRAENRRFPTYSRLFPHNYYGG